MKFFLLALAICASPDVEPNACVPSEVQATVYEHPTFARCIQDREWFRLEGIEAYCTGTAWVPPHLDNKG